MILDSYLTRALSPPLWNGIQVRFLYSEILCNHQVYMNELIHSKYFVRSPNYELLYF